MEDIQTALRSVIDKISDENYDQSFTFYRLWFQIAQIYSQNPPDQIFDAIYDNRGTSRLIYPTARSIVRFASDAESDHILAPHCVGLQSRLCTRILRDFFEGSVTVLRDKERSSQGTAAYQFPADTNFIAHWANLGYVEEAAIRHHILQSLISHPKLYDHQADALIILFKLAGATFDEYGDPSAVDRCFELLKDHYQYDRMKRKLVEVCVSPCSEG